MIQKPIALLLPFLPKKFVWLFSRKYIAGAYLNDAIKKVIQLNERKISATIDILGESIISHEQALAYQRQYLVSISRASELKLNSTFSLKPSMFGLLWDEDFCYRCIKEIVLTAQKKNYSVRIDMEDSGCTDKEIVLFEKLYREFPDNIGIVFQACLKRTSGDLEHMRSIARKEHTLNIRLCKGIYRETPEIAFQTKKEIRNNFLYCLEYMIENNMFPAIATHDNFLIEKATGLLTLYNKTTADYEFQMLLGVTPNLCNRLATTGHSVRIYVPYGEQWLNYCSRRLLENPHIITHILTGLFIAR